jgi:hypothetical protein
MAKSFSMTVTFTRTGKRRYRVAVEGPGVVSAWMEPAPGYDARLPHDVAHFVVENELGISGGIFGQLAAGGTVHTFHPTEEKAKRKIARRSDRIAAANREASFLSEKIVYISMQAWTNPNAEILSLKEVTPEDIRRICRAFDAASAVWSKLAVGESMTLVWRGGTAPTGRRR